MADHDMLDDPTSAQLIVQRFKKNPYLLLGCTGFLVTAAIGIYKFKSRPKNMSAGSYLIQLRVLAQSMVVGSLAIGMTVGMIDRYILHRKPEKSNLIQSKS